MADQNITESMIAQAMMKVMGQANGLMNNIPAQQPVAQAVMPAPQQQVGALPNPSGWSVPIETDLGGMTVTVYVQFPAHTFPQYQQIIATMLNMGYNIRSFQKSNGYGGNSSNSWGNRGGGYGGGYGRGGYGRGGYGRGY
ncbi:MAG: hypothetical protein IKB61_02755 [Elusimicrobiaceae bacterium]|nr:hypothetical protein [Elusimicrobiaceae bacterium]MBR4355389.1 hypothetical protein [Elusimicrobiaceae bacterium]